MPVPTAPLTMHNTDEFPGSFSSHQALSNARLCAFLQDYGREETFDPALLVGMKWIDLQRFARLGRTNNECLIPAYRPIVGQLLSALPCSMMVKGYFSTDSVECLVLVGRKEVVVVFRDLNGLERSPVNVVQALCSKDECKFSGVGVYPPFKAAYLSGGLESWMGEMLDELYLANPDREFVMAGHSCGGALATLAAFRYAQATPEAKICCLVTSCPTVGGASFRTVVESMHNLEVVNVTYHHHHQQSASTASDAVRSTKWGNMGKAVVQRSHIAKSALYIGRSLLLMKPKKKSMHNMWFACEQDVNRYIEMFSLLHKEEECKGDR